MLLKKAIREVGCGLLGLIMVKDRNKFNHLRLARLKVG